MPRQDQPQDEGDEASVNSSQASLDDDLQTLKDMDIDADFNQWSSFRGSFSVQKRESLKAIGNSKRSVIARKDKAALLLDTKHDASLVSITEIGVDEDPLQLTSAEQKDIRKWNARLNREQVFSRYYFPEQWELREMKTIQKFLNLDNPNTTYYKSELEEETQQRAISSIFFPDDYDMKSVLMKRGPILLDGIDERELFLFSHGFLLSRIEFDALMNLLFHINEKPEQFDSLKLKERFDQIDTDKSGEIDRCELREIFLGMGVPIGEGGLSEIFHRVDTDCDGTITFDELQCAMLELTPTPKKEKTLFGTMGKTLTSMFSSKDSMLRKLDGAYLLSDIERIEGLNMCHCAKTRMFAESSFADLSFAIIVKGQEQPLVMICSKPEHKDAWLDSFKVCIVNSIQNGSGKSEKQMREKIGWQHQVIRVTIFSLVVTNSVDGLHKQLTSQSQQICVDEQDEYHGFTALHYAAALGRLDCAVLLLQAKVNVNVKCNEQKTPLDYAMLHEKKDMIQVLQQYGAKTNSSGVLFEAAIEEQKRLKEKSPKTGNRKTMLSGAKGAMSEAMNALRERGDRIEKLDKKTAELQNDAQNYAEMAKQLKEKTKKKSTFFGR